MAIKVLVINSLANVISVFHVVLVFVAAFGWWFPFLEMAHISVLVVAWLSWVFTGSCLLAHWEYSLRAIYNPQVSSFQNGYLHYHLRSITKHAPSVRFIRIVGLWYLTLSIILWIINYFVL